MALINCSECSIEISDKAAACPKCGNPIASANSVVQGDRASGSSVLAPSGAAPGQERSFYSDALVRVTNARVIIGPKTYSLANVSSVSLWTQPAARLGPLLIGIIIGGIGLLMTIGSFAGKSKGDSIGCALFMTLVGGALFLVGILLKDTHWVRLTAAGGETNALSSKSRDYILAVVGAINEAIVHRG